MGEYVELVRITGDDSSLESTLTRASSKIRSSAATWSGAFTTAGKALDSAGKRMITAGRTATTYLTLPIVGAGVAAVKMALDFNRSFTLVQALAGKTGMSLDQMKQSVLSLAGRTAQDPQHLAQALYFVASAGLKASQVMPVLQASAKGAAAGLGDVVSIAQLLTSVMNAYAGTDLTAAKAMNIFTEAAKLGKAEASDFATGLGPVVGVAAQAGVSLNDLAAAIAQATNLGLPFARAVTASRFLIQSLVNPTKKAADGLKSIGLSQNQVASMLTQPGGLENALQTIFKSLDMTTASGRAAWAAIVGGARGAVLAADLVGSHVGQTSRIVDGLAASAKSTSTVFDGAFNKMANTDAFKFQQALVGLKIAMIQLGNTLIPILERDVIPAIEHAVQWFSHLSAGSKHLFAMIAIGVAAGGPLLMFLGALLRIGGGALKLIGFIGRLGGAILGMGTKITTAAIAKDAFAKNLTGTLVPAVTGGTAALEGLGLGAEGAALGLGGLLAVAVPVVGALAAGGLAVAKLIPGIHSATRTIEQQGSASTAGGHAAAFLGSRMLAMGAAAIILADDVHKSDAATQSLTVNLMKLPNGLRLGAAETKMFSQWMSSAHHVTAAQRTTLAGLVGTLQRYGGSLTSLQSAEVQHALNTGHVATAEKILKGAIDSAKKSSDSAAAAAKLQSDAYGNLRRSGAALIPKIKGAGDASHVTGQQMLNSGANAARAKPRIDYLGNAAATAGTKMRDAGSKAAYLAAKIAALKDKNITVTTNFVVHGQLPGTFHPAYNYGNNASGGITTRMAMGGITRAASGLIARAPTLLIGEGQYPTPFGRGVEANVPLDSRGIGILAKALEMAQSRRSGKGRGDGGVHLHFHGPVYGLPDFRRAVVGLMNAELGFHTGR